MINCQWCFNPLSLDNFGKAYICRTDMFNCPYESWIYIDGSHYCLPFHYNNLKKPLYLELDRLNGLTTIIRNNYKTVISVPKIYLECNEEKIQKLLKRLSNLIIFI